MVSSLLTYFLQLSLVFSLLYALYYFLLRKLTFHSFNRGYLLALMPLSILLPYLASLTTIPFHLAPIDWEPLEHLVPIAPTTDTVVVPNQQPPSIDWAIVILRIYLIGLTILFIRFLRSIWKLFWLSSQCKREQLDTGFIYVGPAPTIFSFHRWIFVPTERWPSLPKEILLHERAHLQLHHSFDLLLTELYAVAFWFNPLIIPFRRSLQLLHEYQADRTVLQQHVKPSDYLQLLLAELDATHSGQLHSAFHFPTIKQRMDMLFRNESAKPNLLKYLLVAPLIVLLSLGFAQQHVPQPLPASVRVIPLSQSSTLPAIWPVAGGNAEMITSHYGMRTHPILKKRLRHQGIDLKSPTGTAVVATADGQVVFAGTKGNWGKLVIIAHANGYETFYSHLHSFNVQKGQQVKSGEQIAGVGNTGLSLGPHLHYEVRKDGKNLDPLDFVDSSHP